MGDNIIITFDLYGYLVFFFSWIHIFRKEIKYKWWNIKSIFKRIYYIRALKEKDFQKSNCNKSPFSDCINLTWLLTRSCVLTDFEISLIGQAMTQYGCNNCYTSAIESILMSEIIFNTHIFIHIYTYIYTHIFCPLLYKINVLVSSTEATTL